MSEHTEQVALFAWAAYQENSIPELKLLYAIPNGGHRHKATAAKMKAEGVKAGVPDVCLPVARGVKFGLYIEMKYGRNKPTPEQTAWLTALGEQGYKTAVCYSFEAARDVIMDYLEQRPTDFDVIGWNKVWDADDCPEIELEAVEQPKWRTIGRAEDIFPESYPRERPNLWERNER